MSQFEICLALEQPTCTCNKVYDPQRYNSKSLYGNIAGRQVIRGIDNVRCCPYII